MICWSHLYPHSLSVLAEQTNRNRTTKEAPCAVAQEIQIGRTWRQTEPGIAGVERRARAGLPAARQRARRCTPPSTALPHEAPHTRIQMQMAKSRGPAPHGQGFVAGNHTAGGPLRPARLAAAGTRGRSRRSRRKRTVAQPAAHVGAMVLDARRCRVGVAVLSCSARSFCGSARVSVEYAPRCFASIASPSPRHVKCQLRMPSTSASPT